MIDLKLIQEEQETWALKNFGQQESYTQLLGINEEAGELNHAHLKGLQGIRHPSKDIKAMKKDAIGDLVIYLAGYCNLEDLSLEQCIQDVWNEVKKRDWRTE